VRIEPREGHFQSFLGDLAQRTRAYGRAERHYDRAIALNDGFFYYYLQRGKVNEATRDLDAARADYARSVKLMPTADAQLGLGSIAAARGRSAEARRWYSMAAQASGPSGERARTALAKLSPQTDPGSLVHVRSGLTPRGTLAFEIANRSTRAISDVQLGIRLAPGAAQSTRVVREIVPAGGRRVVDTGRRFTRARLARLRVSVLGAKAVR